MPKISGWRKCVSKQSSRAHSKLGMIFGFCGHYSKPHQWKFLKDDGATTTSDLETGKVFCDYFTKVFNNSCPTEDSILDSITQHETLENLGVTTTIT